MRSVGTRMVLAATLLLVMTNGCAAGATSAPTAPSPTTARPATAGSTPIPAATPSPVVADLSLSASKILTNGSTGAPSATLKVTVHNQGSSTPALTVTFKHLPMGIAPIGDGWGSCDQTDDGTIRTIACPATPVTAGGTATFTYTFRVTFLDLGGEDIGTVSVAALDAQERDAADNTAKLAICTNGCTF